MVRHFGVTSNTCISELSGVDDTFISELSLMNVPNVQTPKRLNIVNVLAGVYEPEP